MVKFSNLVKITSYVSWFLIFVGVVFKVGDPSFGIFICSIIGILLELLAFVLSLIILFTKEKSKALVLIFIFHLILISVLGFYMLTARMV